MHQLCADRETWVRASGAQTGTERKFNCCCRCDNPETKGSLRLRHVAETPPAAPRQQRQASAQSGGAEFVAAGSDLAKHLMSRHERPGKCCFEPLEARFQLSKSVV